MRFCISGSTWFEAFSPDLHVPTLDLGCGHYGRSLMVFCFEKQLEAKGVRWHNKVASQVRGKLYVLASWVGIFDER